MIEKTEKRAYAVVRGVERYPWLSTNEPHSLMEALFKAGFQPGDEVEIRLRVAQADCAMPYRLCNGTELSNVQCGAARPCAVHDKAASPLSPPSGQEAEGKPQGPQALPLLVCDRYPSISHTALAGHQCVNPRPAHPPAARTEPRCPFYPEKPGCDQAVCPNPPPCEPVSAAPVEPAPHAPSATPEPEKLGEEVKTRDAMILRLVQWIEGEGSIVPTKLVAAAKKLATEREAPTTKVGE